MEVARTVRIVVDKADLRLDKYISQSFEGLTRSYLQKLIDEGRITVNDRIAKPSHKPRLGDVILIHLPPPPTPPALIPEDIPLTIVYENDDILVIDKPADITVHPAPGHASHTLMNAILAHCPDVTAIDSSLRPGIVHRLDKDTSGLMVVAKNKTAHLKLATQMKNRRVIKRYLVLVKGRPSPEKGSINAPIGRHPRDRKRMAVVPNGREAHTFYQVVQHLAPYTLIEATLHTGRTHQIRVHFSSIGCPVAGDPVYGVRIPGLGRQFLHAFLLGFNLPSTGEYVEFRSELPSELQQVLDNLARYPSPSGK
ncbi:MAG: RluA family pseudouridine synthase [Chloroflexi bacterium]|nr:RluA family pseudouridine synthase [Chloroflexota bacterium]